MNCMQPQGSSMQSLGVGPARLLNSSGTVWVPVCLLCHTPFCTTALWVLLFVMEARVVCVHCSRYIGVFHSAREMDVSTHGTEVSSILQARPVRVICCCPVENIHNWPCPPPTNSPPTALCPIYKMCPFPLRGNIAPSYS